VYVTIRYFEKLAARYRGKMRLMYIFPGLVVHEGMYSKSNLWWIRIAFTKILPFFGTDVPLDEAGERIVSLASGEYYPAGMEAGKEAIMGTDGKAGSGAYTLGW
jgi:hypothetical protein